ncbi:MAG: pyridoxamine 5'-phosphate oxidase family protein [Chloroflexota bacterium]
MNLKEYFDTARGRGILATSDGDGKVGIAVYSRPHVMDDGTLAFVMRERLAHRNVTINPHAAYMYIEDGPGYRGVRLFLRKVGEEIDPELISKMTRRWLTPEEDRAKGPKHLVVFAVDSALPLIGTGE